MRERLVNNFQEIFIDDMQGSQRANRVNNGNVFTTDLAGGVRVGICIAHYVKKKHRQKALAQVHYREFGEGSGASKRKQLVEENIPFETAFTPTRINRYVLKPLRGQDRYWLWPNIQNIFPVLFSGVNTNRDEAIITFDEKELQGRMQMYYNKTISDKELAVHNPVIMKRAARYDPHKNRKLLLEKSTYQADSIIQYHYRPFDKRWLYWEEKAKLLNEKRKEFFEQVFDDNAFLVTSQTMRRGYDRHLFSKLMIDLHIFDPDARAFPLTLRHHPVVNGQRNVFDAEDWQYLPNIADFYDDLVKYKLLKRPKKQDGCTPMPKPKGILSRYGISVKDTSDPPRPTEEAFRLTSALFYHTLAILHTPKYREDHEEYLSEDWPRIPLPKMRDQLEEGEELGKQIANLLDPLSDTSGVLAEVQTLGKFAGQLDELKITSNPYWENNILHLSESLRLENVPKDVWDYTLGGYPVLNKWLSYRKDRLLNTSDALWLCEIIQRIAVLIRKSDQLDTFYESVIETSLEFV
ncbi:MAG: type ISP restriction/modification enzyme [Deinococcales bacterium]